MTIFRTSGYNGSVGSTIAFADQGGTSSFISGGTMTYASGALRGTACGRYTGIAQLTFKQESGISGTNLYWRGYFRTSAVPNSNRMIVAWRDGTAGSGTVLASLGVDTASVFRLRNTAGVTTARTVTSFLPNTWYGLIWQYNPSAGTQSLRMYEGNGTFIEEISGGADTGTVVQHDEGVLQGDAAWSCDLDDTAIANEALELTGNQTDPDPQGPNDPYRESPYDGPVGGTLDVEGGNGYYAAFDGLGHYHSPGFNGGVCARYTGQYALKTQNTFKDEIHWKGWIRPSAYPDTNRVILDFWDVDEASQASIGLDTDGHWRLRETNGITVATSVRRITPGTWYGVRWIVNRGTGLQEARIYSYFGQLLETLSGFCGLQPMVTHLEGCVQGRDTWFVDFDQTVLHRQPVTVTSPLSEIPSNFRFRDGMGTSAPLLEAFYWNGTTLTPLEIVESL